MRNDKIGLMTMVTNNGEVYYLRKNDRFDRVKIYEEFAKILERSKQVIDSKTKRRISN
mgnify:CR=1 FL=1